MIPYFQNEKGELCRIVSRTKWIKERGFEEAPEEFNIVQVRRKYLLFFSRWVDIEYEYIPSYAWISQATTGFTDWKSELIEKYRPAIVEFKKLAEIGVVSAPEGEKKT